MISPDRRFSCLDGERTYGPNACMVHNFLDFDTRKWLKFEGPVDPYDEDDVVRAREVLLPVIDQLEEDVTKVKFSADGTHWEATNSPCDDITPIISYSEFTEEEVGTLAKVTLKRGDWEEVDRLGPRVDLIRTRPAGANPRSEEGLFVFKYNLLKRDWAERSIWTSAFYHRALSSHPNVVPFGDFVIHETFPQLVGYTTRYIPGGSLEVRRLPVFKLKWVKQLTGLIDLLNLKYGILHQDVVPKNLVLDDKEDQIQLFDFEHAAFHGSDGILKWADDVRDVCFTVYELLTGDVELGDDRWERNLQSIMNPAKPWIVRESMQFEPGVSTELIKIELKEWAQNRHDSKPSTFELQSSIYCPGMTINPILDREAPSLPAYYIRHADPEAQIVRWERPATAHLLLRRNLGN